MMYFLGQKLKGFIQSSRSCVVGHPWPLACSRLTACLNPIDWDYPSQGYFLGAMSS